MDLQIGGQIVKPVGEQWILVHQLRIGAPVFLLLYLVVDVGYDANVMGVPNKVDKLP